MSIGGISRSQISRLCEEIDGRIRPIGAILLEQNDEWAVQPRHISLESVAYPSDDPRVSPTLVAAPPIRRCLRSW